MATATVHSLRLPRMRAARKPWVVAFAGLCTLVLLAALAEIVLDGAVGHSPLIPKSPQIAGWLDGIGERLGYRVFLVALLAFSGAYAGLLAVVQRLPVNRRTARWAIGLVVALHAIVFAGPILISTDVFSFAPLIPLSRPHNETNSRGVR